MRRVKVVVCEATGMAITYFIKTADEEKTEDIQLGEDPQLWD